MVSASDSKPANSAADNFSSQAVTRRGEEGGGRWGAAASVCVMECGGGGKNYRKCGCPPVSAAAWDVVANHHNRLHGRVLRAQRWVCDIRAEIQGWQRLYC